MNRLSKSSDTPVLTKPTHELLGNTNEAFLTRKIAKKKTQAPLKMVVVGKLRLFLFFFFSGCGFEEINVHIRDLS